jgi:hypothetical protein
VSSAVDDTTGNNAGWDKLRRRIEELQPLLKTRGSLVLLKKRRRLYWYLRYSDSGCNGPKQRSVYVGSDDNARRVRDLLEQIRAPGEFLLETLRLADLARHIASPLLRRRARMELKE